MEPTSQYKPTKEEDEKIGFIWERFQSADQVRKTPYRYFNDRSLIEYINDSVDRFNGYIEPREDPAADWGSKVFNNVTRNKTISIIAQATSERVKAEFFAQNRDNPEDRAAARISKKFDDHAAYINRDEEGQFLTCLEASVKGTVIGFESFKIDSRKVKELSGYDPNTAKVLWDEKTVTDWNDVYSEIIPLLDIYPGNIWERDIQKQPYIFWRTILSYDQFRTAFKKYPNSTKVPKAGQMMQGGTDETAKIPLSVDLEGEDVEVIRYFCKNDDEFHIMANGVLLTQLDSFFPWNHKRYPFWKTIFEPFAIDFFYGKSLPDKLKSDQDVLNTLYRMMIDQTYLGINKPIVTSSVENLKDTYLFPGAKYEVDDVAQFREVEISDVSSSQFKMLELVQSSLTKSSIDDPSQGVAGSRSTAFEVGVAREAAVRLLSLFLRALESGVRDKTELRLMNQFQFYQLPERVEEITGPEDAAFFNKYKQIVLDKTVLSDGTVGTQVIRIVEDSEQVPDRMSLDQQETDLMGRGSNVAFSYVTKQWLQDIELKVHIIPNSSVKMSEALQRATEIDYQKTAITLYPDIVNKAEMFRELNEVYDKDPNRMVAQSPEESAVQFTPPGGEQPASKPMGAPPSPEKPPQEANMGANEVMNSPRGMIREGMNASGR